MWGKCIRVHFQISLFNSDLDRTRSPVQANKGRIPTPSNHASRPSFDTIADMANDLPWPHHHTCLVPWISITQRLSLPYVLFFFGSVLEFDTSFVCPLTPSLPPLIRLKPPSLSLVLSFSKSPRHIVLKSWLKWESLFEKALKLSADAAIARSIPATARKESG